MTITTSPDLSPAAPATLPNKFTSGTAIVLYLATFKLLLHLFAASGYGIFRDELYFIVCGWRLDWGYVDQPPLVPLLARMGTALFGTTAFGVRFFAAVAGALTVAMAGLTARELGGRRFAQALACVGVLAAPHYLGSQGKLATDTVEPLFWAAASYVLVRIIRREEPELWPWFGLLAGLGLQSKHSTVFFGFAVILALLLTPQRRLLWNRWFALAGLVAFLVFLPNLVWQIRHDWATLELLRNVKNSHKNIVLGPLTYFLNQILMMHPLGAPLWLAGVGWFLFGREGRRWRVFALAYVALFVIFVVLKGKAYYLASVYVVLIAGGAVWLEMVTQRRHWIRWAYVALLAVSTVPILPLALPVLP
ncbi:MAG TPA: glycosyltransferase family 39 protein [Terriglobales bacterium]|jgi:4-amino-4-deoxy-L-arabinose transferase-like glycosyltransferase|nr:glycosyltransferase family 39 protein [Terriglobales bacterium]